MSKLLAPCDVGRRKTRSGTRKAWERAYGPIPEGLQVLHKCDNPPCHEPTHLFLGTHQDNMDDKKDKDRLSRSTHRKGTKHSFRAKLLNCVMNLGTNQAPRSEAVKEKIRVTLAATRAAKKEKQ